MTTTAALPAARGPLSAAVLDMLSERPPDVPDFADTDPFGDDLQLALHLCYELHYQGLPGVDEKWEWHPGLLALRAGLEARFEAAMRAEVEGGEDVQSELDALLI